MLQKNYHFLFPQTYFGSLENIDEALESDEIDELEINPWVLMLETNSPIQIQQKIGVFIHWSEHSG